VDYRKTSPAQAYLRIAELAQAEGVAVRNSEVVGLLPLESLHLCARQMLQAAGRTEQGVDLNGYALEALKLKDFAPADQVIELKMGSR
jgi:glutamate formiminotransferase